MISDASVMVRRRILADVGGYEEGRRICDSVELWSRLFDKTQFANLPDIVRIYRRHPQALTIRQKVRHDEARLDLLKRNLESLWGEAPDATVERLRRAPLREKVERRADRKLHHADMDRLIESYVAAGWIEAKQRSMLRAAMEDRLRLIRPRRRHFWKHLR